MSLRIVPVELADGVGSWFTGRDTDAPAVSESSRPGVGMPGNLAHRRPHQPARLARDRARVAEVVGHPAERWHLMRQVHGASVAVVDASCPPGRELRDVDGAVTSQADRPLVVQAADCVPILLGAAGVIGVAHAGRRGVHLGVVAAVVSAMTELGAPGSEIHAAIGPAIGGCCYEVPEELQEQVAGPEPSARATTTWGRPSLDLPAAVRAQLERSGVGRIADLGTCTRCDPEGRWFSHRADPSTGRQIGIVVRNSSDSSDVANWSADGMVAG